MLVLRRVLKLDIEEACGSSFHSLAAAATNIFFLICETLQILLTQRDAEELLQHYLFWTIIIHY